MVVENRVANAITYHSFTLQTRISEGRKSLKNNYISSKNIYIKFYNFFTFAKNIITMLAAIKGYYENGQIILQEKVPVISKTEVMVIFSEKESESIPSTKKRGRPGALKGKVTIPDDFNDINVFM